MLSHLISYILQCQKAFLNLLCTCRYVCICVLVCRDHRLASGVFLNHSLLYVLRQAVLLTVELENEARLLGQKASGIPFLNFPSPGITSICLHNQPFHVGNGSAISIGDWMQVLMLACKQFFGWAISSVLRFISFCRYKMHINLVSMQIFFYL